MEGREAFQVDPDLLYQSLDEQGIGGSPGKWRFVDFSDAGGEYHANLPGRRAEDVQVDYEVSGLSLLHKCKKEQEEIIQRTVKYLNLEHAEKLSPLHCFAAALPQDFLPLFTEWLEDPISLQEILAFIRFEVHLRYYNISAQQYRSAREKYDSDMAACYDTHRQVRARMSKVDVPNRSKDVEDSLIDPVLKKLQKMCREHWVRLFFVKEETWVNLSDDKLPHHEKEWEMYGIRLRTTSDMVEKPIIHVLGSVSNGLILGGWLKEQTSNLNEIVTNILLTLFQKSNLQQLSVSERRDLIFFINQGSIALNKKKQQKYNTNLLQILLGLGAGVLCTCRMTQSFPFQLVCEFGGNVSTRPQIHITGKRSLYLAERVFEDNENQRSQVSAVVFRHGIGHARAGLLVTNVKSLCGPSWVFEISHKSTTHGSVLRRNHTRHEDGGESEEQAFRCMEASIYHMTLSQRSADWFLAQMFRATGTLVLELINCTEADYFYPEMKPEHELVKQATRLNPRSDIVAASSRKRRKVDQIADLEQTKEQSINTIHDVDNQGGSSDSNSSRSDEDVIVDEAKDVEPTPEDRKLCFLRHVMPAWFMHPTCEERRDFAEGFIHKELDPFLEKYSEYRVMRFRDYGLVCSRATEFAAASPDAVCSLSRAGSFSFVCAVEIKTNTSSRTETETHNSGTVHFATCDVGTEDFQKQIASSLSRCQTIHHAAVLGLENVLVVFASCSRIARCVMVRVPLRVRDSWLKVLQHLQDSYMGFVFRDKRETLPRLGPDGSSVYGDAIDHHTVDTYIKLWKWHRTDVIKNGTPPPCTKLIPKAASVWSHAMGSVDTVREVLGENVDVCFQLGPTSIIWMTFFEYVLNNAFRLYQLTNAPVERVEPSEDVMQQRTSNDSYSEFLNLLALDLKRRGSQLSDYLPSLQQLATQSIRTGGSILQSSSERSVAHRQKISLQNANFNEEVVQMRLDGVGHSAITEPGRRGRCVVCCEHCLNKNGVREHKYRAGSKTVVFCKKCNVFLCKPNSRKKCFVDFHNLSEIPLPPCQSKNSER